MIAGYSKIIDISRVYQENEELRELQLSESISFQEIIEMKIDRECIDPSDPEMLEELVKTAVNQAVKESQDMVSNAMSKLTGGMNIPGLF